MRELRVMHSRGRGWRTWQSLSGSEEARASLRIERDLLCVVFIADIDGKLTASRSGESSFHRLVHAVRVLIPLLWLGSRPQSYMLNSSDFELDHVLESVPQLLEDLRALVQVDLTSSRPRCPERRARFIGDGDLCPASWP